MIEMLNSIGINLLDNRSQYYLIWSQFETPLKPLCVILQWFTRGFREGLDWTPMLLRDSILSDGRTLIEFLDELYTNRVICFLLNIEFNLIRFTFFFLQKYSFNALKMRNNFSLSVVSKELPSGVWIDRGWNFSGLGL